MAYVCYQKLTKRKRREVDRERRVTWGTISPVTKKVESKKVYNRKKAQRWQPEPPTLGFLSTAFASTLIPAKQK